MLPMHHTPLMMLPLTTCASLCRVLSSLGVRPLIMGFLKRDEDDVKQQALLACSKLLVSRWQFVAGGSQGNGVTSPVAK